MPVDVLAPRPRTYADVLARARLQRAESLARKQQRARGDGTHHEQHEKAPAPAPAPKLPLEFPTPPCGDLRKGVRALLAMERERLRAERKRLEEREEASFDVDVALRRDAEAVDNEDEPFQGDGRLNEEDGLKSGKRSETRDSVSNADKGDGVWPSQDDHCLQQVAPAMPPPPPTRRRRQLAEDDEDGGESNAGASPRCPLPQGSDHDTTTAMELMESVKEQIDARLSARHWLDEAVAEAESDSSPTEDAWDDEPSPFSAMPTSATPAQTSSATRPIRTPPRTILATRPNTPPQTSSTTKSVPLLVPVADAAPILVTPTPLTPERQEPTGLVAPGGEGLPNSERSRRLLSFGVILHTPRSSNSTQRNNSGMGGRVVSETEPKPTPSTHRRSLRALLTAPLVAMRWSHSAQRGSRYSRRADSHHDTHSTPMAKGHAAVGSSPLQAATHTQMWL